MNCPSCNAVNYSNAKFCTNCGAPLATAPQTPYQAPASHQFQENMAAAFVYAGFWKRVIAWIIDGIIFGILSWIVFFLVAAGDIFSIQNPGSFGTQIGLIYLFSFGGWWMYFAIQESSSKQATLGKRALGIKVCDMNGQKLSFGHAAGRQLAGAITYMTFTIGYLLAAFTGRKQALHDMIASCVVVNKNFGGQQVQAANMSPPPGMSVGAIIGVLALVLIIPVGGIIAAIALPAYHDYTIRAQVSAAYSHAQSATYNIVDYAEESGYWPQNFEQAGLDSEEFHGENYHIRIGEDGVLLVRFNRPQQISTGLLEISPELTTTKGYVWNCRGIDVDSRYLPRECQ